LAFFVPLMYARMQDRPVLRATAFFHFMSSRKSLTFSFTRSIIACFEAFLMSYHDT